MSDDDLFATARRVNAALMAKIHTIEWTPAVLPHPTVGAAMRGNWYGMFGPRGSRLLRRLTRSDLLTGIPGSPCDDHGAAYSLTEEFVAVYRMHPLIPDEVALVRARDGASLGTRTLLELTGPAGQVVMDEMLPADLVASLAVGRAGRIALNNYPDTLRNLPRGAAEVAEGDERLIDLATIDVAPRPRARHPALQRLPPHAAAAPGAHVRGAGGGPGGAADRLREVYGDVERVDLMVGLYAEPLPDGFGFSETAFRIFVLMASRRLKSDPAFTDDWRPEVYTREGLRWIEERTMQAVIADHLPTLRPLVGDVRNAFAPWDRDDNRLSGRTDPFPAAAA